MNNKLLISVFIMVLNLVVMPSFAFSNVMMDIAYGYNATPSEGIIIIICVGVSLYLFGCNLEWKLSK